MHRSQLAGIIIDCQGDDLDTAANFWGQALGYDVTKLADPKYDAYRKFETRPGDMLIDAQRVDHPSGVHLDIETDDVEAEVQRLEALGAKRLKQVKSWWIMEAPTGHRFCVVRVQHENFSDTANKW